MTRTSLPLHDIKGRSPLNVRSDADAGDVEGLAASIAAVGLVQPILVRDDGAGWETVDGGRRHAALRLLREKAKIPADYLVSVIIDVRDLNTAREASLAANVMREPLHPVDEFETFTRLVRDGMTPERIAADFNMPTRQVRQRLALDKLSPVVRDLWRRGEITTDAAEAFTTAPNHAAQEAYLAEHPTGYYRSNAASIRHHFTSAAKKANSPEAIYVGLEAYQAAGGTIDDNLFEDFSLCLDGALLTRLAREKMQAEGEALMERYGYGFLAFRAEVDKPWDWTRLPGDLTREERARIEAIDAECEQIQEQEPAPDELAVAEAALRRLQGLEDESEEIQARAAHRGATAAQRATAGILLMLTADGRLSAELGMVPPKADKRPRVSNTKLPEDLAERAPAEPAKIDPEPRKPGKALIETIDAARTAAFAQLVAERPDLAMILATAVLATSPNESPLRVTVQERNLSLEDRDSFAGACTRLLGATNRDIEALRTRFATAVASIIVVRSQGSNTYVNPVANPRDTLALSEIVAGFCGGDAYPEAMREHLDYDAYFKAATREAAVQAVFEAGGDINHARTLKKGELAAFAAELARDKGWLPRELRPPEALPVDHPHATPIKSLADAMAEALADHGEVEGSDQEGDDFLPFSAEEREAIETDLAEPEIYAVSDFLTHECEKAAGEKVKAADLFAAYQARAGTRPCEAASIGQFGEAVAAYGITKHRLKTGVHYQDVRLVPRVSQEAA